MIRSLSLSSSLLAFAVIGAVAQGAPPAAPHPDGAGPVHPNFELPAQWSAAKVNKLVFDTTVTPHWYSTSDKFWYSYKTSTGTAYYVVNPAAGTKAALFDHVKVAEQLTVILGLPYDGEHLPLEDMRLINNDTALRFRLSIPRTAIVPGLGPESADELKASQTEEDQSGGGGTGGGGRGGRAGRAGQPSVPRGNRNVYFELDLATQTVKMLGDYQAPKRKPTWAQISPDGKTVVFSRNHNLYMMNAANYAKAQKDVNDSTIQETQLTTDGEEFNTYGRDTDFNGNEDLGTGRGGGGMTGGGGGRGGDNPALDQKDTSKNPRKPAVRLIWSRDSSEFVLTRADERKVADLWVIHTLHNPRPILETYKYAMPGEENVPLYSLWVFNVAAKTGAELKADAFKDQHFQVQTEPVTNQERAAMPDGQQPPSIWLGGANDKLYFMRISRDLHKVDICTANPVNAAAGGDVKAIIEQRSNVYIMTKPLWLAAHGTELLLWSERDGWGHYYLYGADGTVKHQVDHGEFVAGEVEAVDDATNSMAFTALGVKAGENVYYAHLYRIGLDGAGMREVDGGTAFPGGGNATHAINASDDGKYFVDNYSRVDDAPQADLFGPMGHVIHLETTDVKALLAAGFQFPTPFTVKADDGITDLFGVMFKPFDFDAHKKYPLVEYVYPGPQTESVEATFNPRSAQMQLAQFGFIVIEVGNRGGSPLRDSWYHTYGYHNLRDYGLADKKHAAEELAQAYPFIDLNRVGITGHSGGGFMSTAALLEYPDFFKVAVSESGNHDNNVYNNTWSEEHDGIQEIDGPDGKVTFQFSIDKNSDLAKNLKGHLLLSTGDMDNNVHMANTMRLANALIRANKRFDLIMLPGERHGYSSDTEWFFWRKAEYFCQYLLGGAPHGADMMPLQREVAEGGKGRN